MEFSSIPCRLMVVVVVMEIVACSADKIQTTSLYSSKAGDNMLFMHVII